MSRHSRTSRADELLAQPLLLLAVAQAVAIGGRAGVAMHAPPLLDPVPRAEEADEL
jgi:hypothetical protein